MLDIVCAAATDVGLRVEGYAAQSENLTEWAVSGGAVKAAVNAAGEFTHDTAAAGGESFGAGASAAFSNSTALGKDSSCSNVNSTAIGASADAGAYGLSLGSGSSAPAGAWNGGRTAVGTNSTAGHNSTIAIGTYAITTATNQFVAGSQYLLINDVYFGKGVTNASPTTYTINGTGGSGTDIAGADINIAGGIGTGTGAGGAIELQTATVGSSGSAANTLTTRVKIDGQGAITFPGIPTSDPGVTGVLWSDSGTLKLSP
jgi:hypothetical protein